MEQPIGCNIYIGCNTYPKKCHHMTDYLLQKTNLFGDLLVPFLISSVHLSIMALQKKDNISHCLWKGLANLAQSAAQVGPNFRQYSGLV